MISCNEVENKQYSCNFYPETHTGLHAHIVTSPQIIHTLVHTSIPLHFGAHLRLSPNKNLPRCRLQ